jgi:DUF4097 and DUF4098 domain-containing protein YvlB
MWKKWGVPVMLASMIVCAACGWNTKEERREAELDAKSIQSIQIEAGSGDLTIQGDDKATSIRAVAVVKTSGGAKDKEFQFTLEKEQDGDAAKLVAKFKQMIGGFAGSRTIDVTVTVPAKMHIEVEDDSGDVTISGINGNIEIDDDSGDIQLKQVQGHVEIKDDSGDIVLTDIKGNVDIEDDSGSIRVRGIDGDLHISDDSGDMTINDVSGSVSVDDDSGDIHIRGVGRDVTINSDGSGGLNVEDVKGRYTKK